MHAHARTGRDAVREQDPDLHAALSSTDPAALGDALARAAKACAPDCGLSDEAVAGVAAARAPERRAARLASLIRSARFAERYEADLATRLRLGGGGGVRSWEYAGRV